MQRQLPSLGPRGEGWVAIQVILFVMTAWAGTLGPAWTGPLAAAMAVAGIGLIGAGGWLAVRGLVDLRENLTPLPHPRAGGRLVDRGAYRLARHPIYGGLVVAAAGYGLLTASPAALAMAGVLLGFFSLKSRREEAWLVAHYPEYPAYAARTRRLIPFLY
jgi:protein-S-isoprenylcysteine O-methyltransferase Ste14